MQNNQQDDINKKAEIYNQGVKAGQEHSQMSSETRQLFICMEKELEKIKIIVAEQKKDIAYIKKDMARVYDKISSFIDKAEVKFADKWVENTLVWVGRIIIGAIILALLGLVITQT